MCSANQEHPKTRTHYSLGGGMLVIFFWTISAANPDRTMRSARPPLFVTLFDILLGRFWRFLGSFWRPERGLGPTWGYLGISKVKVCTPSFQKLPFLRILSPKGDPIGDPKSTLRASRLPSELPMTSFGLDF